MLFCPFYCTQFSPQFGFTKSDLPRVSARSVSRLQPLFLALFCFNIPDSFLPQFYHHSNPQFSLTPNPWCSRPQVKFVQCLLGLLGLRTLHARVLNRLRRPARTRTHEPQNFSPSFSISYKPNKKYFLTRIAVCASFALDSNANHSFFSYCL